MAQPRVSAQTVPRSGGSGVWVNWVWPLIDQPHRLSDRTVFTDDLLVNEVAGPDGPLYRALQVVQQVGGSIPISVGNQTDAGVFLYLSYELPFKR